MSGRRGFLAFLGGASVAGVATTRASATTPTLILPPGLMPAAAVPDASRFPLLAACGSPAQALAKLERLTPPDVLHDLLEGGLRVARFYNDRTEAELDRLFAAGMTPAEVRGDWS